MAPARLIPSHGRQPIYSCPPRRCCPTPTPERVVGCCVERACSCRRTHSVIMMTFVAGLGRAGPTPRGGHPLRSATTRTLETNRAAHGSLMQLHNLMHTRIRGRRHTRAHIQTQQYSSPHPPTPARPPRRTPHDLWRAAPSQPGEAGWRRRRMRTRARACGGQLSFSRAQVERSLLYTLPGGLPRMRAQMASRATRMFWKAPRMWILVSAGSRGGGGGAC